MSVRRTIAKLCLVAALVVVVGAAFMYRMWRDDMRVLAEFMASYEQFDQAVSEQTLTELRSKSAMQISSLVKNDGSMMKAAREVSDLATNEVALMKASEDAHNDKEKAAALEAQLRALQQQRKAAYANFQRLLAEPPNS